MNFIVFDLELTCWEGDMAGRNQEIIEIGALKIDSYGHIRSRYSRFVKPILYPILSPYCAQLTSIKQENINSAKSFKYILPEFIEWIEREPDPYFLVAWGHHDREYLIQDSILHKLETDWMKNIYFDLNKKYLQLKKLREPIGLISALTKEGFEFEGTPHRADDDAYNLSRIFLKYFGDWDLYKG